VRIVCAAYPPKSPTPQKIAPNSRKVFEFLELQTPKLYAVSKGCLFKSQKISCRRKPLKILGEQKSKIP